MPGVDCNCLLQALRYAPGKELDRDEASNLRVKIGQHVMENLGAITGGSSGESFREHIDRDPASAGVSTPEGYNRHMFHKQSRAFCGTLGIEAFVRFIKPGTLVAIYTPLPGDKTTYQNDAQGTFKLREQHCGLGPVQHTTNILHSPGHHDYVELIFEEDTWTSPRLNGRRATQRERRERRERTPSPPPLMSSSDDESELDGEEAMCQSNLTDAGQDDNEDVPEAENED